MTTFYTGKQGGNNKLSKQQIWAFISRTSSKQSNRFFLLCARRFDAKATFERHAGMFFVFVFVFFPPKFAPFFYPTELLKTQNLITASLSLPSIWKKKILVIFDISKFFLFRTLKFWGFVIPEKEKKFVCPNIFCINPKDHYSEVYL